MKTNKTLPLDPLAEVSVAPSVAAFPKANRHLHLHPDVLAA